MRKYLFLSLLGFCGALSAEPLYTCQKTADTITVDGILDELTWKKAEKLSPFRDLSGKQSDYGVDLRMAYDREFLYFAAVLPTRDLRASLKERDSIIYHDDDFEIFIDPGCNGRNYLELEINALNTVWDLLLTAPYREGQACIALHDWDIKRLKHAVTLQGTLNTPSDRDRSWTVEIAWPWESITGHGNLPRCGKPPLPGREMRFNFSRVDHPGGVPFGKPGYREVNTVWSPTRQPTIHAPELWGRVRFSEKRVGTPERFPPRIGLWVHGNDRKVGPERIGQWKQAGVTHLVIDGPEADRRRISSLARQAGLKAIAWFWTLNRPGDGEALKHPEWYAVSGEGKSCFKREDRPFVPYYQFLCPTREEPLRYLESRVPSDPETDAVQLDYIRMPDVRLPPALWSRYKLDMSRLLPAYDFCYCSRCLAAFGRKPVPLDPLWTEFRLLRVAHVANTLAKRARALGKPCGAALFPTPKMAAEMVRQDWSRFDLDFGLVMTYMGFYQEDTDWILSSIREGRREIGDRFPLYPGLFLPDFTPESLRTFLPALLEANPRGFCLFSHSHFSEEYQRVVREALESIR